MLVLRRGRGQKIEIEGNALICVARVEDERVRLDVTMPFLPLDDEPLDEVSYQTGVIKVIDIQRKSAGGLPRAHLGIHVPAGTKVRRPETQKGHQLDRQPFPWHRYRPSISQWLRVDEELKIPIPREG